MNSGVIIINKPTSWTSHDVVAKLRGIAGTKKVGHTGTLDPDATGLLPICIGRATKLSDILSGTKKKYYVEFILGYETDTEDISGKVVKESSIIPTHEEIEKAIFSFKKEYDQIPPMYSAIKVKGKRLYEIARSGEEIERKTRKVNIIDIENISIHSELVTMEVTCSKGTYIRSLCRDIGRHLGSYATMSKLIRTQVGSFDLTKAVELKSLNKENIWLNIIPLERVLASYPRINANQKADKLIKNGNPLPLKFIDTHIEVGVDYLLFDAYEKLIGIFYKKGDMIFPKIILMEQNENL